MTDPYDLQRFVDAQDGGTYDRALAELRAGRKASHWMWFVFPQVSGLGRSDMAVRYALSGVDEARAYRSHPVLGPVDAQKLHSSLTLFAQVGAQSPAVDALLARHFGGELDAATLSLL